MLTGPINISTLSERIRDVVVVTVTPFDQDLHLDLPALEQHLKFLSDNGIRVVTVNGGTGEFYALTVEEANRVVDCVTGSTGTETTVIASVGHDLNTAINMAKHAESVGCDGVMVHYPSNPYVGDAGYLDYMTAIADAVEIGIVPYIRSGLLDDSTVLRLLELPNVVAIKYAVNDLLKVADLIDATPDDNSVTWCCGTAEAWAPLYYAAGATAFTSGLANVAPKLALAMRDALASDDAGLVRRIWTEARPFEELRTSQGSAANVTVLKEAMHRLGLGSPYVRSPAGALSESASKRLDEILTGWAAGGYA